MMIVGDVTLCSVIYDHNMYIEYSNDIRNYHHTFIVQATELIIITIVNYNWEKSLNVLKLVIYKDKSEEMILLSFRSNN